MGGNDLKKILLGSEVAADVFACGRGGRSCAEWRQRAFLDTRVHICFVVVADIEDIVVAVYRSRQSLQADVSRAAVACKAHRVKVGDTLCSESGFNACQHGSGSGKGGYNGVVAEAKLRKVKADSRHTACRKNGDGVFAQNL